MSTRKEFEQFFGFVPVGGKLAEMERGIVCNELKDIQFQIDRLQEKIRPMVGMIRSVTKLKERAAVVAHVSRWIGQVVALEKRLSLGQQLARRQGLL